MRKKQVLERAQHNAIAPHERQGEIPECESAHERKKRNADIIECDPHEHVEWAVVFVNPERISVGNILFGHIHIIIPQYAPHKLRVIGR